MRSRSGTAGRPAGRFHRSLTELGKSTVLALISGVRKIQSGRRGSSGSRRLEALSTRAAFVRPDCLRAARTREKSVSDALGTRRTSISSGACSASRPRRARRPHRRIARQHWFVAVPDRLAGKLSGGMKQKLSLCCSLIHDPDLLILDEPTTGVDPLSRRQFWELIGNIRRRRPSMSVMVATAYMEEAEQFDWLAAMDAGRVIATGILASLWKKATEPLSMTPSSICPPKASGPAMTVCTPTYRQRWSGRHRGRGSDAALRQVHRRRSRQFHIERGEIFGFLGSNGCGKTTTMKMLTGLLAADGRRSPIRPSPGGQQYRHGNASATCLRHFRCMAN